jgi:hypothetical protein
MSSDFVVCSGCQGHVSSLPHCCLPFVKVNRCNECRIELKVGVLHKCPGCPSYDKQAIWEWLLKNQDGVVTPIQEDIDVKTDVMNKIRVLAAHKKGVTVLDFVNQMYQFDRWSKDTLKVFKALLNDDYFVSPVVPTRVYP